MTHPNQPTSMTLRHFLTLTFTAAAIFASAQAKAEALTVTDDSGATVTLTAPAQRIVSLAPHVTELLFAAGGGARVVGAVSYSDYPPQAKTIPRVGDNKSLDLERIVAMKADLIVVWRHGNAMRQIDRLRELHVPLFFSEPHKLDDIPVTIDKLGVLLGTSAEANKASNAFRDNIAGLRTRYANRPPVSVFYQVWDDPLMTLNGTHIISEVIDLCGGHNVFNDLKPLVPTISTEAVLAANPEAIVTATPGATSSEHALPSLDAWRKWPSIKAVARNNLFGIDGDLINRPTPRLALGATALCEDLEVARTRRPK
ncbi:cobalamin-binding protein [Caballeronia sp. LjRoot29]|uniref:cobalamin-binding protein n=1 Tax=Caballeronia sp. LjRoot29 TaxID=3342315 RepID=UPI003ED10B72